MPEAKSSDGLDDLRNEVKNMRSELSRARADAEASHKENALESLRKRLEAERDALQKEIAFNKRAAEIAARAGKPKQPNKHQATRATDASSSTGTQSLFGGGSSTSQASEGE